MRGLWCVSVVFWGVAALAQPLAIVSIEAGPDRLDADAAQILTVAVQSEVGGPRVVVTLDPVLRAALQALTESHIGQEVVIRVCGQVVSRPTLWSAVTNGVFAVQGDDLPTARHLAQVLRSKDCSLSPST